MTHGPLPAACPPQPLTPPSPLPGPMLARAVAGHSTYDQERGNHRGRAAYGQDWGSHWGQAMYGQEGGTNRNPNGEEAGSHRHPLAPLFFAPSHRFAARLRRPFRFVSRGGGAVAPPLLQPSHNRHARPPSSLSNRGAGRCGVATAKAICTNGPPEAVSAPHPHHSTPPLLPLGAPRRGGGGGGGGDAPMLCRHRSTWPSAGLAFDEKAHGQGPARGERALTHEAEQAAHLRPVAQPKHSAPATFPLKHLHPPYLVRVSSSRACKSAGSGTAAASTSPMDWLARSGQGRVCKPIWPYFCISTAGLVGPHTDVPRPPAEGSVAGETRGRQINLSGSRGLFLPLPLQAGCQRGEGASICTANQGVGILHSAATARGACAGVATRVAPAAPPVPGESGDFRGARAARQRQSPARSATECRAGRAGTKRGGTCRSDVGGRRTGLVPRTCPRTPTPPGRGAPLAPAEGARGKALLPSLSRPNVPSFPCSPHHQQPVLLPLSPFLFHYRRRSDGCQTPPPDQQGSCARGRRPCRACPRTRGPRD